MSEVNNKKNRKIASILPYYSMALQFVNRHLDESWKCPEPGNSRMITNLALKLRCAMLDLPSVPDQRTVERRILAWGKQACEPIVARISAVDATTAFEVLVEIEFVALRIRSLLSLLNAVEHAMACRMKPMPGCGRQWMLQLMQQWTSSIAPSLLFCVSVEMDTLRESALSVESLPELASDLEVLLSSDVTGEDNADHRELGGVSLRSYKLHVRWLLQCHSLPREVLVDTIVQASRKYYQAEAAAWNTQLAPLPSDAADADALMNCYAFASKAIRRLAVDYALFHPFTMGLPQQVLDAFLSSYVAAEFMPAARGAAVLEKLLVEVADVIAQPDDDEDTQMMPGGTWYTLMERVCSLMAMVWLGNHHNIADRVTEFLSASLPQHAIHRSRLCSLGSELNAAMAASDRSQALQTLGGIASRLSKLTAALKQYLETNRFVAIVDEVIKTVRAPCIAPLSASKLACFFASHVENCIHSYIRDELNSPKSWQLSDDIVATSDRIIRQHYQRGANASNTVLAVARLQLVAAASAFMENKGKLLDMMQLSQSRRMLDFAFQLPTSSIQQLELEWLQAVRGVPGFPTVKGLVDAICDVKVGELITCPAAGTVALCPLVLNPARWTSVLSHHTGFDFHIHASLRQHSSLRALLAVFENSSGVHRTLRWIPSLSSVQLQLQFSRNGNVREVECDATAGHALLCLAAASSPLTVDGLCDAMFTTSTTSREVRTTRSGAMLHILAPMMHQRRDTPQLLGQDESGCLRILESFSAAPSVTRFTTTRKAPKRSDGFSLQLQRRNRIECAVMHLMKRSGTMNMADLCRHVGDAVSGLFQFESFVFTSAVEELVRKEYLAHDVNNPGTLRYLA